MKKLMFAIGLGLLSGSVYASCVGPYCWDDTGATIYSSYTDSNGAGMPNVTTAAINAQTPKAKGQEVFCTDCTAFNGGKGSLCVSTGTTVGSYMVISSGTAIAGCK